MIGCADVHEILSAYVDGEEHEDEAAVARGHLESCARCRELLEDWEWIDRLVAAALAAPAESRAADASAPVPASLPIPMPASARRRRYASALAAAITLSMLAGTAVFSALGTRGAPAPREVATSRPTAGAAVIVVGGTASGASGEPGTVAGAARPERDASPTGEPRYARAVDEELSLLVGISSNSVPAGAPIRTRIELRNVSERRVDFLAPVEAPVDVVLRSEVGFETYRRSISQGWSGELLERTLRPGEAVPDEVSFAAPAPGRYLLFVECACDRSYSSLGSAGQSGAGSAESPVPGRDEDGALSSPSRSGASHDVLRTAPIALTVLPARP